MRSRLAALVTVCALAAPLAAASAQQQHFETCQTAREIIAAEAYNRGHEFKDARIFGAGDAVFLSRWAGMAFPGVEPVVIVSYSDGSVGIISFVGLPECWRVQVLERRS